MGAYDSYEDLGAVTILIEANKATEFDIDFDKVHTFHTGSKKRPRDLFQHVDNFAAVLSPEVWSLPGAGAALLLARKRKKKVI